MARTSMSGWSTLAVFTAIGVVVLIGAVVLLAYRRPPMGPLAIPALLALAITPAVVPAGMRLAGQRLPARPFAGMVGIVIAIQLVLTNFAIPLAQQETARRNRLPGVESAARPLSAFTALRLAASISRGDPGAWIARNELARRAALAAAPALLGIIGWQLGILFGARWPTVAAAWCAIAFFVTVTTPSPSRGRWWLASLWLWLLAIGLTAAARTFTAADQQSRRLGAGKLA